MEPLSLELGSPWALQPVTRSSEAGRHSRGYSLSHIYDTDGVARHVGNEAGEVASTGAPGPAARTA